MDVSTTLARLGNAAASFLNGKHQLFIDGKFVDAKSGKTFDVFYCDVKNVSILKGSFSR